MAKIYTKTGDKGETGLFGGERIRKSHPRIRAYGAVDELNALVGQARVFCEDHDLHGLLARIQNDLFDVGALLATRQKEKLSGRQGGQIRPEDISFLEETIDRYDRELPHLRSFILPGGGDLASILHVARAVCRRAEREIVELSEKEAVEPNLLIYMNRLSDLLFVLARWANFRKGIADLPWEKKG